MRFQRLSVLCAVAIAVASLAAPTVSGQSSTRTTEKRGTAANKSATLRTPWGAPDLQGTWDFRTVTPMERPPELAGKATLTEKEAAEYERRIALAPGRYRVKRRLADHLRVGEVDVVPGQPDKSILLFRVKSTTLGIMMPEVGRSVVHTEGAAAVAAWISSLTGTCP